MDCRTAQFLIELGRAELDGAELEAFDSHLAECLECAQRARTVEAADVQIGAAMRQVPVPAALHDRLVERLREQRAPAPRRLLRSLAPLAAAAAILIAVCIGWTMAHPTLSVDYARLEGEIFAEIANPSREMVEEWLHERQLSIPPPPDFDYRLLVRRDITLLQGQQVPILLFARTEHGRIHQARVYLLSADQFSLAPAPPVTGSVCNIVLLPHPTFERYAYLVVYTGELAPFLDSLPTF